MGHLLKPGFSTVLLSYCRLDPWVNVHVNGINKRVFWDKNTWQKCFLVMLFHRKMRQHKKYRALTDTDPLVHIIMFANKSSSKCRPKYLWPFVVVWAVACGLTASLKLLVPENDQSLLVSKFISQWEKLRKRLAASRLTLAGSFPRDHGKTWWKPHDHRF